MAKHATLVGPMVSLATMLTRGKKFRFITTTTTFVIPIMTPIVTSRNDKSKNIRGVQWH